MHSGFSSHKNEESLLCSNKDSQDTNRHQGYPTTKCTEGTNVNETLIPAAPLDNEECMQFNTINRHNDENCTKNKEQQRNVNPKQPEQDSSDLNNNKELHMRENQQKEFPKKQDIIQKLAQVQEEYDALRTYVNEGLKPLISRLKRMNAEKDLDLHASAKLISELQQAQHPPCSSSALADTDDVVGQLAQVQEEYDALKTYVNEGMKPLISRLKRMNAEKDLDLRASAKLISELQPYKGEV
ncbi:uncharacterized protein TM35_000123130 [Trypanosoma theileri]|uniref:Uncharacterized protein n=1 Tax=Trypanosoma theileri TaxID=67003 RepID=A0A1X0NYB4_9TRYP|nr:uncharacterized protein TM35_000123130 [Trypanosoma theileri]ORC89538.1 hypothetical protein TM35_000123130 [Trypanosoma theileri]